VDREKIMKPHLSLTAMFLAGVFAGCAPEGTPQALVLQYNSVVSAKNSCVLRPASGAGQETRSVGMLDLLIAPNYLFFPALANKLATATEVSALTSEEGVLEPHLITLTGARVWYEIEGLQGQWDGSPTILPDEVFAPTSGVVEPSKFIAVIVEILPPAVVRALDGDTAFDNIYSGGYLIAHVVVEGRTLDGMKVRSNEFVYPIHVCRGCLLYWPFSNPLTCCDELKSDEMVCYPGQDEAFPCDIGCAMVEFDPRADAKQAMIKKETNTLAVTAGGGGEDDVIESDVEEDAL